MLDRFSDKCFMFIIFFLCDSEMQLFNLEYLTLPPNLLGQLQYLLETKITYIEIVELYARRNVIFFDVIFFDLLV